MLPQYQRHVKDNLEAAERREQRLMHLLRQSNEMQRGMSAQIKALKAQVAEWQSPSSRRPKQQGLPPSLQSIPNPTNSLRYQETPPLGPVTQDMLNSQMHRLRTSRRMDTPSHRQFRNNGMETSQLHPEIYRNLSFQGSRPKQVRLDKWNLKFDGSGRGMTVERSQEVFREFHILLAGALNGIVSKWRTRPKTMTLATTH